MPQPPQAAAPRRRLQGLAAPASRLRPASLQPASRGRPRLPPRPLARQPTGILTLRVIARQRCPDVADATTAAHGRASLQPRRQPPRLAPPASGPLQGARHAAFGPLQGARHATCMPPFHQYLLPLDIQTLPYPPACRCTGMHACPPSHFISSTADSRHRVWNLYSHCCQLGRGREGMPVELHCSSSCP